MPRLKITGGYVLVSQTDLSWAKQFKWYVNDNGYVYRSIRTDGRLRVIRMHRELTNAPRGTDVDHKNGVRHDNRRRNLRLCSRSNNLKNKTRLRSDNSSGVTGVFWHGQCSKWTVQIQLDGRPKHLGLFASKQEAIRVRRAAEIRHYGRYAPRSY